MRSDFTFRYGPWAVVTGASSGIGEAIARDLSARGVHVVLCARRKEKLDALAAELSTTFGTKALAVEVDLSRDDFLPIIERATASLDVGLLVNNAGFGDKTPFLSADIDLQLRMLHTNCRAPLVLSHAFAKRLVARGRGGILFTASTAAFQGLPFASHYAATKGYDLQLAEGLWYELLPHGVDVVALCPGPVDTEGPRRTGVDSSKVPIQIMDPETVAKAGLNALGRGPMVIPGVANRLLHALVKVVPRWAATAVSGRMIQRVTHK